MDLGHTVAGWTGTALALAGFCVTGVGVIAVSAPLILSGIAVIVLAAAITWLLHLAGWGKPSGPRAADQWDWRVKDLRARRGHPDLPRVPHGGQAGRGGGPAAGVDVRGRPPRRRPGPCTTSPSRARTITEDARRFGMGTLNWARLGTRVTGVDSCPEAFARARRLAERAGLEAEFVQVDAQRLPDALAATFDLVVATYGVLSWVGDLDAWMSGAASALRPGGRLVLVDSHPVRDASRQSDPDRTVPPRHADRI